MKYLRNCVNTFIGGKLAKKWNQFSYNFNNINNVNILQSQKNQLGNKYGIKFHIIIKHYARKSFFILQDSQEHESYIEKYLHFKGIYINIFQFIFSETNDP
jgi:hypothetical protein